jgi:Asp-tRNA(Asn)/Glu-tRNA(Gln) amidotransferase A subunit family amidase
MIDPRLLKLFAWTIGVLILLWMLTECLGGVDEADPDRVELDRDTEQYAADCDRAWEALDLVAQADGQNVDAVVDRINALGAEIEDPELKAMAAAYAQETQSIVTAEPSGEALDQARIEYRDTASLDLAMRCPVR